MTTTTTTPEQCFRNAGQRVRERKPFCHPGNGSECAHDYHERTITEPSGEMWVLADGSTFPLHTQWALCPDHEEN